MSNGVISCWFGGESGPQAICDVLLGKENPGGKLPFSLPRRSTMIPCYYSMLPGASNEYYEGRGDALYPFGFGLYYTNFELSSKDCCESDGNIVAIVNVKNIGDVAGKEVVQVYYSAPQGLLGKPAKQLIGYKKTKLLEPGEKETVAISFKVSDMASFDDLGKCQMSAYVLEQGFRLGDGNAAAQTVIHDILALDGERTHIVIAEYQGIALVGQIGNLRLVAPPFSNVGR